MYKNQRKYSIKIQWQAIALNIYCPYLINRQHLEKLKLEYYLINLKTAIISIKPSSKVLSLSNIRVPSTLRPCLYSPTKSHSKRHTMTPKIRPT